ncbi:hypothetical protein [Streptomyces sp. NPDC003077]|uniref:hypothetical protein n=1 Tax=Streptomyces sp. NPDC003077 TaxID=3154443 RepID=UPI0033B19FF0
MDDLTPTERAAVARFAGPVDRRQEKATAALGAERMQNLSGRQVVSDGSWTVWRSQMTIAATARVRARRRV